MSDNQNQNRNKSGRRIFVAVGLVATVFVASFAYASSQATRTPASGNDLQPALTAAAAAPSDAAATGAAGGGCCGGSSATVEGKAEVSGGVQRVKVDASQGSFSPNRIVVKAGVPIEIEFSQAPGGCLSRVQFPDFGIDEDLTAGPKTVKIAAQKAGEYSFSCQMQMVFGTLVVQ